MIQQIGFKNFRRFENFPNINLGNINIFVGRNNAGKSTVLKALQLFKGNLNTLSNLAYDDNTYDAERPMFIFDVDSLSELHIDNFERALYNKAKRKEITLSATVFGHAITIVLDGQNIEKNNNYIAVPYNFIEIKDQDFHLTFNFMTRELDITIDNTSQLSALEREFVTRLSDIEESLKANSKINADIIKEIDQLDKKFIDNIKKAAKEASSKAFVAGGVSAGGVVIPAIGTIGTAIGTIVNISSSLISAKAELKETNSTFAKKKSNGDSTDLAELVSERDYIKKRIKELEMLIEKQELKIRKQLESSIKRIHIDALPDFHNISTTNIIESIFKDIDRYSKRDFNLDERTSEYKIVRQTQKDIIDNSQYLMEKKFNILRCIEIAEIEYIHAHAASQKVIYLKEDKNDALSNALHQFCRMRIGPGDVEWTFIKKWMGKDHFDIGDDFIINDIESSGYTLRIKDEESVMNLADKGTGTIQLMTLLLSMAVIIGKTTYSIPTVLIEEPEQNIHPMLQSMLADMFLDFWKIMKEKRSGAELIIETHSEYLIRRTQIIAAEQDFKSNEEVESEFPFKLFYFENKEGGLPYEIKYSTDGKLDRPFGEGFFDAAGNIQLQLMKIARGKK